MIAYLLGLFAFGNFNSRPLPSPKGETKADSGFRNGFVRTVLFAIGFATLSSINAQPSLPDVQTAFNAISSQPQVLHIKNGSVKIPAGGHLQGIQCLNDSAVIITASSASYSYYLIAQLNKRTGEGKIKRLQKIADSPYRHAGGCQVNNDTMMVGIEDNRAKDKSQIVMVSFNDSSRQNNSHITLRRQGLEKRSTAGAVGFTKTHTGQYLVAVGDWDSRNIDYFYISRKGDDTLLDSITTFHAPDNAKWCSYQAINLVIDSDRFFMIGFCLDGISNRADLFEVIAHKEATYLRLISTRNFKCKGGASFRYGSGIYVTPDGKLSIYSCGRNVSSHTPINIFR